MKVTPTPITKNKEDWINRKWRPAMAWTYLCICVFDFVLAPVLNYTFFSKITQDFQQWKPLTMIDGGLFHLSMGAIIGITAWQRGEEKKTRYRSRTYYENDLYDDEEEYNTPRGIDNGKRPINRSFEEDGQ